jgi:hypothetical protein
MTTILKLPAIIATTPRPAEPVTPVTPVRPVALSRRGQPANAAVDALASTEQPPRQCDGRTADISDRERLRIAAASGLRDPEWCPRPTSHRPIH